MCIVILARASQRRSTVNYVSCILPRVSAASAQAVSRVCRLDAAPSPLSLSLSLSLSLAHALPLNHTNTHTYSDSHTQPLPAPWLVQREDVDPSLVHQHSPGARARGCRRA